MREKSDQNQKIWNNIFEEEIDFTRKERQFSSIKIIKKGEFRT